MDDTNKAILVIGPPRSGTSITTKIIQEHLNEEFPFEVNRHVEPEELVQLERNFLERSGKDFIDRLHFPELKPDFQLFRDLLNFYEKYSYQNCVIKSPIFSIFANWLQLPLMFKTVFVYRSVEGMAGSLMYHKKMSEEEAMQAAKWYYENSFKLRDSHSFRHGFVMFSPRKELYMAEMKRAIDYLDLTWDEEKFNKHWNQDEIEYYKK